MARQHAQGCHRRRVDGLILEGNLDMVTPSAASIHVVCFIRNEDIRIFFDGTCLRTNSIPFSYRLSELQSLAPVGHDVAIYINLLMLEAYCVAISCASAAEPAFAGRALTRMEYLESRSAAVRRKFLDWLASEGACELDNLSDLDRPGPGTEDGASIDSPAPSFNDVCSTFSLLHRQQERRYELQERARILALDQAIAGQRSTVEVELLYVNHALAYHPRKAPPGRTMCRRKEQKHAGLLLDERGPVAPVFVDYCFSKELGAAGEPAPTCQRTSSAQVTGEIGAALVVGANGLRMMERFGYMKDNLRAVRFDTMVRFESSKGDFEGMTTRWTPPLKNPNILCHRSDLWAELERLALGPGEGPAAVMHISSKVLRCDTAEAALTLNYGRMIEGDAVLGADGISSTIRTQVLGRVQKSIASGMTGHRTVLDASVLAAIPGLEWIRSGDGGMRAVFQGSPVRGLLLYPCRNGTRINFNGVVPEKNQDDPAWSAAATREEVQALFAEFHPQFQPLFAALPDKVLKWQMRTIPALETWTQGSTALLGDAAHAMLPSLGQGGAMALEDAAALGALLPAGTTRADIPMRLTAYESLRKPRAEWVARESLWNGTNLGDFMESKEMHESILDYDAAKAAEDVYQERFGTKESEGA
ncbi:hypothetical protein B0H17DRAFT_1340024 [Mycena rosella]|uniref:FAD-binding domain-containing protein n=1 Tax=Mycena rosella TaxID=1033263 RepID=A0AAD7BSK0_MYCRO|nr:hypothetical protein B0H17DRAFT_1340024 [Mycena rosella]